MKRLIIITLAVTSLNIQAEETANILADQVIHNYKSVPMKISGRQPKGELCLWNHAKKVWSCSKTDSIPTGGVAVLRDVNKSTMIPGGPPRYTPTYYRQWINPRGNTLTKTPLYNSNPKPGASGYGHVIVTDVGEIAVKEF